MNRHDNITRRRLLGAIGSSAVALLAHTQHGTCVMAAGESLVRRPKARWYEDAFYLLHLDHHTSALDAVGAEADPVETERLIALSQPDVIQIHAKGNPGWTTYPTRIGHTPPKLARDVLAIWRDLARRRGYAWSIYYNFGRDREIMRRRPEWNRVGSDGKPRDNMLCYQSGVLEGYLLPMIAELTGRHDPDAFWFDGSCFTVLTCYCPQCRERFRRESGLDLPKTPAEEGWDQFKEMQRQIYREAVVATCAGIKRDKPDCRVAFNWAYSLHMPEEPPAGISHLTGDTAEVERLSAEAHWYDAQPRPFDLMTPIWFRQGEGQKQTQRPKTPEQLQQEMAVIIANGGRYHAWDNPSRASGLDETRQTFLGSVAAPFLRSRQPWCLGSERLPSVSLLFTSTQHYADTRLAQACLPNASHTSFALRGASEVLSASHLDYELVSRERLLRQEVRTRLLIAEDPAAARPDEVAALRRFAETGGTVVLTGRALNIPELAALSGLRLLAAPPKAQPWWVRLGADDLELDLPLAPCETIVMSGSEVLIKTVESAGVYPLVVRSKIDQGEIVAVACPIFSLPKPPRKITPDHVRLRTWLLERIAPLDTRPLTTDAPERVEIIRRKKNRDIVLHLVNRAPGRREEFAKPYGTRISDLPLTPAVQVSLRMAQRPVSVRLQPQNGSLDNWEHRNGVLRLEVPPFPIHQMIVIRLE